MIKTTRNCNKPSANRAPLSRLDCAACCQSALSRSGGRSLDGFENSGHYRRRLEQVGRRKSHRLRVSGVQRPVDAPPASPRRRGGRIVFAAHGRPFGALRPGRFIAASHGQGVRLGPKPHAQFHRSFGCRSASAGSHGSNIPARILLRFFRGAGGGGPCFAKASAVAPEELWRTGLRARQRSEDRGQRSEVSQSVISNQRPISNQGAVVCGLWSVVRSP